MDNNDHFSIHAHPSPETSIASKLVASPDSPVAGDSNICKKSQVPLAWCLFENWEQYLEILTKLCHLYNLPMETIGKSICGRDIPMVRLGNGKHKVLYVGTHHGCEWLTGALLLRFIDAYGTAFSTRQRIAGVDLSFLYHTRSIFVVPVCNPDGMQLALCNDDKQNPNMNNLIAANGGSRDFSHWKANGRGVDLNRNYDAGFAICAARATPYMRQHGAARGYCGTKAESEPETQALCDWIRKNVPLDLLLSFHTAGEEIYDTYEHYATDKVRNIARILSRFSGYALCRPPQSDAHGGLKDWYLQTYRAPGYTIECGRGETPLPSSMLEPLFIQLTSLLFCGAVLS